MPDKAERKICQNISGDVILTMLIIKMFNYVKA